MGLGAALAHLLGDLAQDLLQAAQWQAFAGLTVAAGLLIEGLPIGQTKQSHDQAHGLSTRAAWIEHLAQESPEGHLDGKEALAAIGAVRLRFERRVRHPTAEEALKVG